MSIGSSEQNGTVILEMCTDFHVKAPVVQIECKMCRCNRVDLTTRVNIFLSFGSPKKIKMGQKRKTLIMHGIRVGALTFRFLVRGVFLHVVNEM